MDDPVLEVEECPLVVVPLRPLPLVSSSLAMLPLEMDADADAFISLLDSDDAMLTIIELSLSNDDDDYGRQ